MANVGTDMEAAFQQLGEQNAAPVNTGVEAAPKKEKKTNEEDKQLIANLKNTVQTDTSYVEAHGKLSEAIEVVNTLGFTDSGDQIHDKAASEKEGKRVLAQVGRIVGYVIKNNGAEPIPYTTYNCTPKADGTGYDAAEVQTTLAPGKTAVVSKRHLIQLSCRPEISFELANAHFKKAPNQKLIGNDGIDGIEDKFYLAFNKKEDGTSIPVHDDRVKKQIGQKDAEGKWHVKKEYAAVLGFVENAKPVKERAPRQAGPKYSSRDAQSLYVAQLFANAGQM
jgi:hypothetical protein